MSKKSHADLLFSKRQQLNERLAKTGRYVFGNQFLARQALESMLPGRKVRSILFAELLQLLNPAVPPEAVDNVVFAIEGIHAASVLVDDVVDNDCVRHGAPSTSHKWGSNKSLLFAHLLASSAISRLEPYPLLQQRLLTVYRQMSLGEMYDLLIPPGGWRYGGYDCRTSQKTHALFGFAVGGAAVLAGVESRVAPLDALGRQMGLLYQLGNDYHDWQPKNLVKRHDPSDFWPVTFSFPLAVYLHMYGGDEIRPFLERRLLSHSDWKRLLERVWKPSVKADCRKALKDCLSAVLADIEACIENRRVRGIYAGIARLTVQEQFWYQSYQVR